MTRTLAIFGATSGIARAVALLAAAKGDRLFLVARDAAKLDAVAADLRVRHGVTVDTRTADLNEIGKHEALVDDMFRTLGRVDAVLIAHGTLGDQAASEADWAVAEKELNTNFIGPASLLTHLANRFQAQKSGVIAAVSSPAGDRGRKANYVYGAAKGGLTILLQGLRNRLHGHGVRVLTIKPGFVDTPMTAHLPKGPLFVKPERVAKDICRAMHGRQDILYTPWFWRWIMAIITMIPERVFKKMSV
jgi:decaprenylphospho-beta-D-erythro-pentofuranosid-2-ulose 2-reductase